ncbi:hypothetical protein SCE1572_18015 [Sorangium cellulosum So0157-2]|uniref:Uncharacterized protein n=1 Tax=Sorangium cellulosum So0157-2 TaxID=1254432 RepID=S4XUK7_SORCE|nr:hypothetical protein SCE1572_18015 [Sorangium cellulosum So0157-2]
MRPDAACSGAMYSGVPTIATAARAGPSPAPVASATPSPSPRSSARHFASPKSSSFRPASAMEGEASAPLGRVKNRFSGLMSRCTRPSACVSSSALSTLIAMVSASLQSIAAPRASTASSVSPSSRSMPQNRRPSAAMPKSWTFTRCSWERRERTRASRRKRFATASAAECSAETTLSATRRPRSTCSAS